MCIGAADSAATLYSYDEGDPDPDLKRFSIDHDREYILPILRRVREINPEVFYFGSPWSPPGWMKWNKSMLGGSMSRHYLASYAQYFLKYLHAYAAEGVPVQAITIQNEIDTDQHGQMPACTWSQECETEFVTDYLGPLFEKTNTSAKIWILDHNYVYWGRVISELDNPDFRRYTTSVAWHGYVGEPAMLGDAWVASTGGTAMVYVSDPARKEELVPKLRRILANREGIDRVYEPNSFAELGLPLASASDQGPDLVLSALPDYSFANEAEGSYVTGIDEGGTHGYLNTDPKMQAIFVAFGAGIASGVRLGKISNLDVAPTIAAILGIEMKMAKGHALKEILKLNVHE